MDWYKQNLDFLKNNLPNTYGIFMNDEAKFQSKITPSYAFNLNVELDHKTCLLHSTYSTERETAEMFSAIDEDVECIVVFGMGLWHARDHIFHTYKNLRHLIIVEPDLNLFKEILCRIDLAGLTLQENAEITLIINRSEFETILSIWNILSVKDIFKLDFAYSLSYRSLYSSYFEEIYRGITDQFRNRWINFRVLDSKKYLWASNTMLNYKYNAVPITKFLGQFEEIPAIIVSAGPSLNDNMHYLKEVKDNAIILAVGSAIKILDSNGIIPHFRLAIDANESEGKVFDGIQTNSSILIFSDALCPGILDKYEGGKVRMALDIGALDRYVFQKLYGDSFLAKSGFSIANVALDLALTLGMKKVIFMGQDLSFTGGSHYAKGSWKKEEAMNFEEDDYISTVNVMGETVYTNNTFLGMRSLFENIIRLNPGVEYINATMRGLPIAGTADKPFEQVMKEDLEENRNVEALIKDLMSQNHISDDDWDQRLKQLNLAEPIQEIDEIHKHTVKKLQKLQKQFARNTELHKLSRDLKELETYTVRQLEELEFYRIAVAPALLIKFRSLEFTYHNKGTDEREMLENNFEFTFRKTAELKTYLDFLSNLLSIQNTQE